MKERKNPNPDWTSLTKTCANVIAIDTGGDILTGGNDLRGNADDDEWIPRLYKLAGKYEYRDWAHEDLLPDNSVFTAKDVYDGFREQMTFLSNTSPIETGTLFLTGQMADVANALCGKSEWSIRTLKQGIEKLKRNSFSFLTIPTEWKLKSVEDRISLVYSIILPGAMYVDQLIKGRTFSGLVVKKHPKCDLDKYVFAGKLRFTYYERSEDGEIREKKLRPFLGMKWEYTSASDGDVLNIDGSPLRIQSNDRRLDYLKFTKIMNDITEDSRVEDNEGNRYTPMDVSVRHRRIVLCRRGYQEEDDDKKMTIDHCLKIIDAKWKPQGDERTVVFSDSWISSIRCVSTGIF